MENQANKGNIQLVVDVCQMSLLKYFCIWLRVTPNRYWLKLIKHHKILLWTPLLGFRRSRKWPDHSFSGPHDKTAKIKIYPWPFLPSGKPFNFTVAFTPGKFMKWHLLMFNSFLTPVALQLIVPFQWTYYNKDLFCDSQFEWIQSIVIWLLQLEKKRYLVGASTFTAKPQMLTQPFPI